MNNIEVIRHVRLLYGVSMSSSSVFIVQCVPLNINKGICVNMYVILIFSMAYLRVYFVMLFLYFFHQLYSQHKILNKTERFCGTKKKNHSISHCVFIFVWLQAKVFFRPFRPLFRLRNQPIQLLQAGWLTYWLIWPHNGMVLENTQFEFMQQNN